MTDMEIISACDEGPDAMVAHGLPRPQTLGDLVRVMWSAQDRLSDAYRQRLSSRDRMELAYMSSATKCSGAYPKRNVLPFPK